MVKPRQSSMVKSSWSIWKTHPWILVIIKQWWNLSAYHLMQYPFYQISHQPKTSGSYGPHCVDLRCKRKWCGEGEVAVGKKMKREGSLVILKKRKKILGQVGFPWKRIELKKIAKLKTFLPEMLKKKGYPILTLRCKLGIFLKLFFSFFLLSSENNILGK